MPAIMIAPWMIKNIVWLDNPVSPFSAGLPNQYVHISAKNTRTRCGIEMKNLWRFLSEVTIRGNQLCGLLGPVFLLARWLYGSA
jgi:hypothetical protein